MNKITKEELIDKVEWMFLIIISFFISKPLTEFFDLKPIASITVGIVLLILVLYFFETNK